MIDRNEVKAFIEVMLTPEEVEAYDRVTDMALLQAENERLRTENAALKAVLQEIRDDAETTIDQYNKLGPTWTSRDSGMEYYDASYVIGQAEERIASIDAARAAGASDE